jgi:hypothetical protein
MSLEDSPMLPQWTRFGWQLEDTNLCKRMSLNVEKVLLYSSVVDVFSLLCDLYCVRIKIGEAIWVHDKGEGGEA